MNNTRSTLTSLLVALSVAVAPLAQEQKSQRGGVCCKTPPVTKAADQSKAKQSTEKSVAAVPLFNDTCPVTGLPTSATTPTVNYANYVVSLCCTNCIPLFARLDKAKKTAFLARFTGENRRLAFRVQGQSKQAAAKSCCTDSGPGSGKGEDAGRCAGEGKGVGRGAGEGKGVGKRKGVDNVGSGQSCCQDLGFDDSQTSREVPTSYLKRLQETLVEELFARDYYRAASTSIGGRRFSNLARAEQHHVDAITSAIRYLGGKPVSEHDRKINAPKTTAEAEVACRRIELLVIKVYEELIRDCPDPALLKVLNRIQTANRRHLKAVGG